MRFTGQLAVPRLDLSAIRAKLDAACKQAIQGALQQFITVATAKIPVWSGASRGTLIGLGSTIGMGIPISPVVSSQIAAGMASSNSSLVLNSAQGLYSFTYETDLLRLCVNEHVDARAYGFHLTNPGPYHAIDGAESFGVVAALNYLQDFSWGEVYTFTPRIINVG